jgi:hypothetical protein
VCTCTVCHISLAGSRARASVIRAKQFVFMYVCTYVFYLSISSEYIPFKLRSTTPLLRVSLGSQVVLELLPK